MFLFSKKFLSLLVVISSIFGGERQSAQGFEKCWKCDGDTANTIFPPDCDVNHEGNEQTCKNIPPLTAACYMKKNQTSGQISKGCECDETIWKDASGNPKCKIDKECYCNHKDRCNEDKSFGLGGGAPPPPTPGRGKCSGSVGTKDILAAMSLLFWIMTAVAILPSVITSTN